jgi:hypothetical protein
MSLARDFVTQSLALGAPLIGGAKPLRKVAALFSDADNIAFPIAPL